MILAIWILGIPLSVGIILDWVIPQRWNAPLPAVGKVLLASVVWPLSMPYLVYMKIKHPQGVIL